MAKRAVIGVAVVIGLLGLMSIAWPSDDVDRFRLVGRRFAIPHRYMVPGFDHPAWVRALPRTEKEDREVLVTVPAGELAAKIPGYRQMEGQYHAHARIRLEVMPTARVRLDPARMFSDMWKATGRFVERRVEADPLPGLFRVYGQYDYPEAWDAMRVSPETDPMPTEVLPTWVARCRDYWTPITPEGHLTSCDSMLQIGDVRVHFEITYQNMGHIDQIKDVLATVVSDWLVDGVTGQIVN